MNAEIYQVSFEQFASMIGEHEYRSVILGRAKLASDIIVGMIGIRPVVYIGLEPPTLFADEAYVWMIVPEVGHGYSLAKYARETLETILLKYPRLFGHCFEPHSARWLQSLGAEFTSATTFEFRRER
jgi:hypothetical protein